MGNKQFYVYIATNPTKTTLYTGVTNDLIRRMYEHKNSNGSIFTSRYKISSLVYFEIFTNINEAINREKQIKGGSRKKKINLIQSINKKWKDLYEEII